ncbi:MAG: TM0106 family RecB-like putative nuclease [Oligoflexales bacterium]
MYKKNGKLVFSPTDLTRFWESSFASWMDRYKLEFPQSEIQPDQDDELSKSLQNLGYKHEETTIKKFEEKGLSIKNIDIKVPDKGLSQTIKAMQEGVDVIFQGRLEHASFAGFSDFLVKTEGASSLGNYHYEPYDTKLSNKLKPYFVIQLCCYADMLASVQGCLPQNFAVILGNGTEKHRGLLDYIHYYQFLKKSFLNFQKNFDPEKRPSPADSRSHGRWSEFANQLLLENDSLHQVARISKNQIKNLEKQGVTTLNQLATTDLDHVQKISDSVLERLKHQAHLQMQSKDKEKPLFEVINANSQSEGLCKLPPPSPIDVFFDIEGFPIVEGGLEYLWGNSFIENGKLTFKDFWAHNREEEKQLFEDFIDWVMDRWEQDPNMHIYHYANYEIAAIKKLMGRFATREEQVDKLLENHVFVDLYQVVKSGLRIGDRSYSIKNVELLYRPKRATEVADGGASVVYYERWLVEQDGETWQDSKILNEIRDYNKDDCDSTYELVEWLRKIQEEAGVKFISSLTEDASSEGLKLEEEKEEDSNRQKIKESLLELEANFPIARLLYDLMDFHKRAEKPKWWRYFERLDTPAEDLFDDLDCLIGLKRTGTVPKKEKQSFIYEYKYDSLQPFKFSKKQNYVLHLDSKVSLKVHSVDLNAGLAYFKIGSKKQLPDQLSLIPKDPIINGNLIKGVEEFCERFIEDPQQENAILDLLLRKRPRHKEHKPGPLLDNDKDILEQITNLTLNLNNSMLCIQGPPGAGKTYTAKNIILELIKKGKRVGITSNSHKAIDNLLVGAHDLIATEKPEIVIVKVNSNAKDPIFEIDGIGHCPTASKLKLSEETLLVGGTAWTFTNNVTEGQFDYLFVDEAGQVSIANLLAMSKSTNNIVIMGDQMQLGQPIEGSHPGESGKSILEYFLQDHATIPADLGVFLPKTFRLHPEICSFISESVYEGRLNPAEGNDNRRILGSEERDSKIKLDSGLLFVPVEHEGNSQASDEEVFVIKELVEDLVGRPFTDSSGKQCGIISLENILFVAPYNFQVSKLKDVLGEDAKVGSVDKFQGQEAPIVILSMCSSDLSGPSSRGVEFLFSKNRLNVALSRAQSLAIVVGNPNLGSTQVSGVEHMGMVNLYCWLMEVSLKQVS